MTEENLELEEETEEVYEETLRVRSNANPKELSKAVLGALGDKEQIFLSVIGAGAVNQATKAVAIARGKTVIQGNDLKIIPTFEDKEIDGEEITGMKLKVEKVTM